MTCRKRGLSSAMVSFARLRTGLTDGQVQKLYHRLLKEIPDRDEIADEDDVRFTVESLARTIDATPELSVARRDSLLSRLAPEHPDAGAPEVPQRVLHAVNHLPSRAHMAAAVIDDEILRTARVTGRTYSQARAMYDEAFAAAGDGDVDQGQLERWQQRGVPTDNGTIGALGALERAREVALADCPTQPTVTHEPVEDDQIATIGYEPTSRYLEVTFHSHPDRRYSYRVPRTLARGLLDSPHKGNYYGAHILGRTEYTFSSKQAWEQASVSYRCATCGRFAPRDYGCNCPPRGTAGEEQLTMAYARSAVTGATRPQLPEVLPQGGFDYDAEGITVSLPRDWMLQEALSGDVDTIAIVHLNEGPDHLTGQVRLTDGEVAAIDVNCPCTSSGPCRHHRAVSDAVFAATQATAVDNNANYGAITVVSGNPQLTWETNPGMFTAIQANPQPPLYLPYDATAGISAPGSGRAFGAEIEFDFHEDMNEHDREQALSAIGYSLYRMRLAGTKRQVDAEVLRGKEMYARTHEHGWVFKTDGSCAGEIASPVMYDTEETWENLSRVLATVHRYGGVANTNTGMHVHVSAGDFEARSDARSRTQALLDGSADAWLRLATHPGRGTHRGVTYCEPGSSAAERSTDPSERDTWVNFQNVTGRDNDHVEFRLWDGTLDPAVSQQQIALSVAAVNLACSPDPIPEPTAYSHGGGDPDAGARRLMDALWWRNRDKQQTARLWSVTSWQSMPSVYPQTA